MALNRGVERRVVRCKTPACGRERDCPDTRSDRGEARAPAHDFHLCPHCRGEFPYATEEHYLSSD